MPLILAIEPDRRQATQLRSMVRTRLKAELVLGESAEKALTALGDRVPDLILTTALLSPRDEDALDERLRALDGTAAHVQTLTIPVLAAPSAQKRAPGVLSALRRTKSNKSSPDGCDPAVFAEQCSAYLDRATKEREEEKDVAPRPVTTLAAPPGIQETDDFTVPAEAADDLPALAALPSPALAALPPAVLEARAAAVLETAAGTEVIASQDLELTAPAVELTPPKPPARVPMWLGVRQLWPVMDGFSLDSVRSFEDDAAPPEYEDLRAASAAVSVAAQDDVALTAEPDETSIRWEDSSNGALAFLSSVAVEDIALDPGRDESTTTAPTIVEDRAIAAEDAHPVPASTTRDDEDAQPDGDIELRLAASEKEPDFYEVEIEEDPTPGGEGVWMPLRVGVNQLWPPLEGGVAQPAGIALGGPTTAAPEPARPEWLNVVESLRKDIEPLRAEREPPVAPPPLPVAASASAATDTAPAPPPEKRSNGKRRRGKAAAKTDRNEWGFFDPEQCGFGALLNKLNEVTEDAS